MKSVICIFLLALVTVSGQQLGFSNSGIDFWVVFGWNCYNGEGQTQYLYISSNFANQVSVTMKSATIGTYNVAAGQTVTVTVSQYYLTSANSVQNQGIRVHSLTNTSFTLAGLNTYPATSDGFLAFPVNTLGTYHVTGGYFGLSGAGIPSYTFAVAPFDGTTVTFTSKSGNYDSGSASATYTLNSYQAVLVSKGSGDVTGDIVSSNKPIAVFGGASCSDIPVGNAACNVLVEQIPQVNTWANDFVTVPFATRRAGDIIRVIANVSSTVVTVNGATVSTLNANAYYEFSSSVPCVIHTSKPAMVMQYDKGEGSDGVSADPFQVWIPPVSQYSANYYTTAPSNGVGYNWGNYLNIVIESGQQGGLSIDGSAVTQNFIPISGSSYSYAQVPIAAGSHHVTHTSPIQTFALIGYGFGYYDGYGFTAGARLATIQNCVKTQTVPGDGIDNDCDGKVDEEILNYIDDDGDGLIDEDLSVTTCCYSNNQQPILTVISGSTANAFIGCGAPLPDAAVVQSTVGCSPNPTATVQPTVTYPSSCTTGLSISRVWSVTDSCGRTATITQLFTYNAVCGNGIVEAPEVCDGGACCTASCTFASTALQCGHQSGPCDSAAFCSGNSATCPSNPFLSSSTVCGTSQGPCDVAATCSGSSASCPANTFKSSSTVCGTSTGPCDTAAQCTGNSAYCPPNPFVSATSVCRQSAGPCDVAEHCTGSSASCPDNSFQSSSTVCGTQTGPCDIAAQCSGSSAQCPSNPFQPSTVTCGTQSGPCDIAAQCSGNSASCPANPFQPSSTVCHVAVGPCDQSETCTGSSAQCPADQNGSFETACPGLALLGKAAGFAYYDVIAFGDFTANTGDIEQRLAVKGNFVVGNGWSVGYQIDNSDGALAYSLVVGGNAAFGSGDVYPDGTGFPNNAAEENMFIGGSFSGPNYLASRVGGNCSSPNCLSSQFAAAQSCYAGYQTALANNADNVAHYVQWSGLYVTCNDATAARYYLTLTASEISSYTWTSVSQCNGNALWTINVVGNDAVSFSGGSFPVNANQIIWNIQGSGRTINVGWTAVDGSILAPYNNVNQPQGLIVGKVIANNIVSLQINKYQCFNPNGTPS